VQRFGSRYLLQPPGRNAGSELREPGLPASGLNLLVSAATLWNTRYLQAALADMGDQGVVVRPELIRHVAPLRWEHAGFTGDYVWDAVVTSPGDPRPLRQAILILAA
jgi:hypothetical protein